MQTVQYHERTFLCEQSEHLYVQHFTHTDILLYGYLPLL